MKRMLAGAKSALTECLKPLDIAVTRRNALDAMRGELQEWRRKGQAWNLAERRPLEHQRLIWELASKSKSQIRQDLFVASVLDFKRDGFFVEFGAAGGVEDSNTYLLEEEFGWRGILAEPAEVFHERLRNNRRASISTKCVWSESGKTIPFKEAKWGYLSTVDSFSATDHWAERRKEGRTYRVETISLMDLLAEFSAPTKIDYISIDTEGSELEILESFDFTRYRISVITCEHNYTPAREAIRSLLASQGYVRQYEDLSQFDDWYVHQDLCASGQG